MRARGIVALTVSVAIVAASGLLGMTVSAGSNIAPGLAFLLSVAIGGELASFAFSRIAIPVLRPFYRDSTNTAGGGPSSSQRPRTARRVRALFTAWFACFAAIVLFIVGRALGPRTSAWIVALLSILLATVAAACFYNATKKWKL